MSSSHNKTKVENREQSKALNQNHQSSAKKEVGGPKGPEPTRFGDWEKAGRCIDF